MSENKFYAYKNMGIKETLQGIDIESALLQVTFKQCLYKGFMGQSDDSIIVNTKIAKGNSSKRIPIALPMAPAVPMDVSAKTDNITTSSCYGDFELHLQRLFAATTISNQHFLSDISDVNVVADQITKTSNSLKDGMDLWITQMYTDYLYETDSQTRQITDRQRPAENRFYAHHGNVNTKSHGNDVREIVENTDQPMTLRLLDDSIMAARKTSLLDRSVVQLRQANTKVNVESWIYPRLVALLTTKQIKDLARDPEFRDLTKYQQLPQKTSDKSGLFDYRSAEFYRGTYAGVDIYHFDVLDDFKVTHQYDKTNLKERGVLLGAGSLYLGSYHDHPYGTFNIEKPPAYIRDHDFRVFTEGYFGLVAPRVPNLNGKEDENGQEFGIFTIFSA